jgi:hypothetical protein
MRAHATAWTPAASDGFDRMLLKGHWTHVWPTGSRIQYSANTSSV